MVSYGVLSLTIMQLGTPTVLVNCAATSISGRPLMSMSAAETERTITTNLTAQFIMLQMFLPGMISSPSGGTIVTISSVLGYIGAANISAYCATKAAQIAMHNSLAAELRQYNKIKTVLVTPGQMRTSLFAGVATPSAFLAPIVEPVELAKEIVSMIDNGNGGHISLPAYSRIIAGGAWAVLPAAMQHIVRRLSGVDRAVLPELNSSS
jgi:short-subunit dehydrogenase